MKIYYSRRGGMYGIHHGVDINRKQTRATDHTGIYIKTTAQTTEKRVNEKLTDWSAFFLPFEQVVCKLLKDFPSILIKPGQRANEPMLKIVGFFR